MEIKIAQIGCGYWGPNLVRSFQKIEHCSLQTVVELSSERQKFLHDNFPKVNVLNDYKDVLNDPSIDGVIIATPAHTHYDLAKEFLRAGKHIFVEKPLATRSEEAQELAVLAEEKQRILMVGHTFLYNGAVRYLKERIQTDLGELYYLYSHRLNLGIVRSDVNVWWNLAPHDISILLYLMDGKLPETISVTGLCFLQEGIEDVAFATLKWESGVVASVQVSWIDPGKVRKMTVVGKNKMIVFDDVAAQKITVFDKGVDIVTPKNTPMDYDQPAKLSYRSGDVHMPKISLKEPLKVEAEHFVECIRTGNIPLSGSKHAVDVVAILEAGQRSMSNGGVPEGVAVGSLCL